MNKNNVAQHEEKFLFNTVKELNSYFVRIISERLGIIIQSHQLKELEKAIVEACHQFNCLPQEYLQMLRSTPDQSPILEHLIARITVGETYFFRDKKQMQVLQENVLPQLIAMKRKQNNLSLRIWSAGCATGEEIYTLAIMLKELLPDILRWRINLLGTDINTIALQKALKGKFTEWSMRSIPKQYKQYYFAKIEDKYLLSETIRDMVKFDYLNLNDNLYPSIINNTNAQDLILCRNVLIYFDNRHIDTLMQKLSLSLIPGGYLFLGASDPINIKHTHLTFLPDKGTVFTLPSLTEQVTRKAHKETVNKTIQAVVTEKPRTIKKLATHQLSQIDDKHITKLLNKAQWQEILNLLSVNEKQVQQSSFLLNAKATALANLGQLDEAVIALQNCLIIDSTNKFSYFTYALVLTELNQLKEAEKVLKKTLFLDHQFVMGHYQLGLLLLRSKQYSEGLKYLQNALNIAKSHDLLKFVEGSQSISYGHLTEILKHEIELYSTLGKNNYAFKDTQKV